MIGRSRALASYVADLDRAAPSEVPVLLLGESGTGKELAARHLHEASGRKGRLVSVNCAAIPRDLVESILFGHRRGAFTSAVSDAPGAFLEAQDGTLFLDEVAELAPAVQPKLLRVLEAREIMPVGAAQVVPTNARVVAATNAHLSAEVAARTFRDDLYARLAGFTVRLPPLRERRVDIALIAARFLARLEDRRLRASAGFVEALLLHDWPLNVRELRNCIETLGLRCEPGTELRPHHVHEWVALHAVPAASVDGEEQARPTREELEALLDQHRGNVAAVATSLACQRKQLYRWFARYGISPARHRPPRA
jgi:DNA-binding NtrC family response regulator